MTLSGINASDHYRGNANAKISFVVYEDYECEYCGKAFRELTKLQEHYKNKISILYKNFPFINKHPHALLAAKVVEACGLQNKFIQAHDLVFENQEYLEYGLGSILRILQKKHSISIQQLNEDLKKDELKRKVNDDIVSGMQCGIKSTPAIFINGTVYTGAVKFDQMCKAVEDILSHKLN